MSREEVGRVPSEPGCEASPSAADGVFAESHPSRELHRLKAERDALNDRIKLIERGIERAAYDACMADQLLTVNAARARDGKPPISMTLFMSGTLND